MKALGVLQLPTSFTGLPLLHLAVAGEDLAQCGRQNQATMSHCSFKFSIVIPLFNKAPYVVTGIQSILAQTYQNFEVIVVDDGSSDGGGALVEAMADSRIRLVRQKNAGVSAARNHGIGLARGEWIAFLDADDWHHPRYLDSLVRVQQVCPQADVAAADYVAVCHAEGIWPKSWPAVDDHADIELINDLPLRWRAGPCLLTSGVAVRRQVLLSMQPCFPPGESRGEDLDLWFRLAERSTIALVHSPLVAYRVGIAGSLTENSQVVVIEPFMLRMRERALCGELTARQRRSSLQLVAHFEVSIARQEITSGNRIRGLQWLLKGRYAASGKRWWLTVVMAFCVPSPLVRRWEAWRIQRLAKVI